MHARGQGSIEYLLIIGAAILVVAIVVIALASVTTTAGTQTDANAVSSSYDGLKCQKDVNAQGGCSVTYTGCKCCTSFGKSINSKCP